MIERPGPSVPDDVDETVTAAGRLETKFRFRLEGRIYQTDRPRPCERDPELFFNPETRRRAIAQCRACHFVGRCGYNAAVIGSTHGVWGGMMLPGNYPKKLAACYEALMRQFEERRAIELPHQTGAVQHRGRAA
ncbi:MAG: WhiB family transcriptional regulator [Mycobacteriaceae bacterium]|nr:WhiB family transcriptional regulator [Mycobacteriaceae bacterium]